MFQYTIYIAIAFLISLSAFTQTPEIVLSNNEIGEQLESGTTVGTLGINYAETGQNYFFSLISDTTQTDNKLFYLQDNNLLTRVKFNFDIRSVYIVKVKAIDLNYNVFYNAFYIKILNKNNWPTGITISDTLVMQHATPGTLVGKLSTIDADLKDIHSYSIISPIHNVFKIEHNSLIVKSSLTNITETSYPLTILSDDNNGGIIKQLITIHIKPSPQIHIKTDTTIICPNTEITLTAQGDSSFDWFTEIPNEKKFIAQDTSISIAISQTTIVHCKGVNYGTDSLIITMSNSHVCFPTTIYELITPNNDNQNDYFYIDNIDHYKAIEVIIRDKYNIVVYSNLTYNNTWQGGNCESGNYFYTITIPEIHKTYSGSILLIK